MRSSHKSKIAGAIVFSLIAVGVVGGMSWATISSLELAKKNIMDEHQRQVSRALWQMDSYIGGINILRTSRHAAV